MKVGTINKKHIQIIRYKKFPFVCEPGLSKERKYGTISDNYWVVTEKNLWQCSSAEMKSLETRFAQRTTD